MPFSMNLPEAIAAIQRRALDRAFLPRPDSLISHLPTKVIKLEGICSYDRVPPRDAKESYYQEGARGPNFWAAISALGKPSAFLIQGIPERIAIYFIPAIGDPAQLETLEAGIRACWSGCRVIQESINPASLGGYKHAGIPHGAPSLEPGSQSRLAIDYLIEGMAGQHWAYLVRAVPVNMDDLHARIAATSGLIKEIRNLYLRRNTAEEENNPEATLYVALLEDQLKMLESSLTLGGWNVSCAIWTQSDQALRLAKGILEGSLTGSQASRHPYRVALCGKPDGSSQAGVATMLNSAELQILASPPTREHPGFEVQTVSDFQTSVNLMPQDALQLGDVTTGNGASGRNVLAIGVNDLCRHVFVSGVPGSGKTETTFGLLAQVWTKFGVPYWVIEPAKQEYRSLTLLKGHDQALVLTLGDERVAPLRLNPFEIPPDISPQLHIDLLRSLFMSAFAGLYPPMPFLLEQALQEIYTSRGWNLTTGINARGTSIHAIPTMTDLYETVQQVADRAGYASEITQNVRTGLMVRVNSLRQGSKGLMLDTSELFSEERYFERPVIFELGGLGDPEVVAFVMGLLLIRLVEHCIRRSALGQGPIHLRHLTVIEEAHRLLSTSGAIEKGIDGPGTREKALQTFAEMLSELRAYHEGLIICDQSPTRLIPEVLKLSNLKIAHRTVAREDREALAGAMMMNESQSIQLGLLRTGEAIAFAEGFRGPYKVVIPRTRQPGLQTKNPSDADLMKRQAASRPAIRGWTSSDLDHAWSDYEMKRTLVLYLARLVLGWPISQSDHLDLLRITQAALPLLQKEYHLAARDFLLERLFFSWMQCLACDLGSAESMWRLTLLLTQKLDAGEAPSVDARKSLTEAYLKAASMSVRHCLLCEDGCRFQNVAVWFASQKSHRQELLAVLKSSRREWPSLIERIMRRAAGPLLDSARPEQQLCMKRCLLSHALGDLGYPADDVREIVESIAPTTAVTVERGR